MHVEKELTDLDLQIWKFIILTVGVVISLTFDSVNVLIQNVKNTHDFALSASGGFRHRGALGAFYTAGPQHSKQIMHVCNTL